VSGSANDCCGSGSSWVTQRKIRPARVEKIRQTVGLDPERVQLAGLDVQRRAGLVVLVVVGEIAFEHVEHLDHALVEVCRDHSPGCAHRSRTAGRDASRASRSAVQVARMSDR
jgi:hypothetical protein